MVKGVCLGLGLDWSLGFLHHYHHDFYDIRYPAETGCFGTILGGLGMGIADMAFLEDRPVVFGLSSDSRFWEKWCK